MSLEDELKNLEEKYNRLDNKLDELIRIRTDTINSLLAKCISSKFAISFDDIIVVVHNADINIYKNGKYIHFTHIDTKSFNKMIELIDAKLKDEDNAHLLYKIGIIEQNTKHIEDRISNLI